MAVGLLPEVGCVGGASLETPPAAAARQLHGALNFDLDARKRRGGWEQALRLLIKQADEAGVLVMVSGVVGSNTGRKLHPGEFRGFAISDPVAPLVFVNGNDTKTAQTFAPASELAHLLLGAAALSDLMEMPAEREGKKKCGAVPLPPSCSCRWMPCAQPR